MLRRTRIDDAAIEALFTGNGAGGEPGSLAAFAGELRRMAKGPVPAPSVPLATMLAEGLFTEKGDLPVTAASNVPGPAPQAAGLPKWRRRKMIEFLAGLSVAAKAAFGVSMAAASVTAAGAAGVLPAPAQSAVANAVEAVTPFSFPDGAADEAEFGERVSTDARDGGVDGRAVADEAKNEGGDDEGGRPAEPGQNGLDQANTTPAAGHVPTAVPAGRPDGAGSQGSTGTDRAGQTPAAGHTPGSGPAGPPAEAPPTGAGSQSSTGTDAATETPAADYVPSSIPPAGPPSGAGRP
ncbi:MAG: hypothetical protein ACLGIO_02210 [Acidimicrobiia bacterium]